jgi:hypothetical protein
MKNRVLQVHRDMTVVQLSTRVVNLSMCIEHIINLVWYRLKLIRRLKIEGSVKADQRNPMHEVWF